MVAHVRPDSIKERFGDCGQIRDDSGANNLGPFARAKHLELFGRPELPVPDHLKTVAASAAAGGVFLATGGTGAGIAAGIISGGASNIVTQALLTGSVDPRQVAEAAAVGGALGGLGSAVGARFRRPNLQQADNSINPSAQTSNATNAAGGGLLPGKGSWGRMTI